MCVRVCVYVSQAGAADAGAALPQYDLLLDNSIDFITADIMQGDNNTLFETAEVRGMSVCTCMCLCAVWGPCSMFIRAHFTRLVGMPWL